MPQLNFFATRPDLEGVIAFVFAETDCRVFESYSEFGRQLREFKSYRELAAAYEVGVDIHGTGCAILLQMLSPSVMANAEIVRISLDPSKCGGHTFRYRISGSGLTQLYLGGVHGRMITHSHYGHFSERGAAKWGDTGNVDWEAFKKISGRFQRHITRKLAVAKAGSNPVLADAFERFKEGYELRWAAQHLTVYEPIPLRN